MQTWLNIVIPVYFNVSSTNIFIIFKTQDQTRTVCGCHPLLKSFKAVGEDGATMDLEFGIFRLPSVFAIQWLNRD